LHSTYSVIIWAKRKLTFPTFRSESACSLDYSIRNYFNNWAATRNYGCNDSRLYCTIRDHYSGTFHQNRFREYNIRSRRTNYSNCWGQRNQWCEWGMDFRWGRFKLRWFVLLSGRMQRRRWMQICGRMGVGFSKDQITFTSRIRTRDQALYRIWIQPRWCHGKFSCYSNYYLF
jgi:hypothetical protein